MTTYTRNLMSKGLDGKMSKYVASFECPILQMGDLRIKAGETHEAYGQRVESLIRQVNDHLKDWNGRGEHYENQSVGKEYADDVITISGAEGALNMGIDLALRQCTKPKKVTKVKADETNRANALAWASAEVGKPDGLIKMGDVVAGMANMVQFADSLIAKYGGTSFDVIEAD